MKIRSFSFCCLILAAIFSTATLFMAHQQITAWVGIACLAVSAYVVGFEWAVKDSCRMSNTAILALVIAVLLCFGSFATLFASFGFRDTITCWILFLTSIFGPLFAGLKVGSQPAEL